MSYKDNIKDQVKKSLEKDTVKDKGLTKEMRQSFLDYSMSVIKSRALPDYRDGLKPVHRRIIYAAYQEKLTHEDKYKKSAAIVGSVMGSYHPHGDAAIYDALVRMTQDFSLRYPLIQGQGNFGSIDGDSPAAMRYTEARLAEISSEFLEGVDESWIEDIGMMTDNYDQSKREPIALPTLIPNVLVNGGEGIAVGMATKIPPHNLSEVIDASIGLIDNPNLSDEDIFGIIKGPDFPTGGHILNYRAIKNYFVNSERGDKSFRIRSRADIETLDNDTGYRIIFKEIPYGVKKSQILKRIAELINDDPKKGKYVEELGDYIDEVRDESNKDGIRIVIECDKSCDPNIVLNNLYKHTRLQLTYSPNLTVLVDNEPKKLSVLEILKLYLTHQREILRARLEYRASRLRERIHILEGRLLIIDDIVNAVKIITESDSPDEELKGKYGIDDVQLKDILSLPIGRLKKLSSDKMRSEKDEKVELLNRTEEILGSEKLQDEELKKRLRKIRDKYGDKRRSEIDLNEYETGSISAESLKFYLPTVLIVSEDSKGNNSYLNRVAADSFKGRSIDSKKVNVGPKLYGDGYANGLVFCEGSDDVLFFTKSFKSRTYRVYKQKAYELDLSVNKRSKKGASIKSLKKIGAHLNSSETIVVSIPKEDYDMFDNQKRNCLVFVTGKGNVNVIDFKDFASINSNGKNAYTSRPVDAEDRVLSVSRLSGVEIEERVSSKGTVSRWVKNDQGFILLFASNDLVSCKKLNQFRLKNRNTSGKKAIRFRPNESLIGCSIIPYAEKDSYYVFTINRYGFGKFTKFSEGIYRPSSGTSLGRISQKSHVKTSTWWKASERLIPIAAGKPITFDLLEKNKDQLSKSVYEEAQGFLNKIAGCEITEAVYEALSGSITIKSLSDYLKKAEEMAKEALIAGNISLSREHIDQKVDSLYPVNKKIRQLYRRLTREVPESSPVIAGLAVNVNEMEDILILTKQNRFVRFSSIDMIKRFTQSRTASGKQMFKSIEFNDKHDWDILLKFSAEVAVKGTNKKVKIEGAVMKKTYNDEVASVIKIPSNQ